MGLRDKLTDADVLEMRRSVSFHEVMLAKRYMAGGTTLEMAWRPSTAPRCFLVKWSRLDDKVKPPEDYIIGLGYYVKSFDTLEEAVLEYNKRC